MCTNRFSEIIKPITIPFVMALSILVFTQLAYGLPTAEYTHPPVEENNLANKDIKKPLSLDNSMITELKEFLPIVVETILNELPKRYEKYIEIYNRFNSVLDKTAYLKSFGEEVYRNIDKSSPAETEEAIEQISLIIFLLPFLPPQIQLGILTGALIDAGIQLSAYAFGSYINQVAEQVVVDSKSGSSGWTYLTLPPPYDNSAASIQLGRVIALGLNTQISELVHEATGRNNARSKDPKVNTPPPIVNPPKKRGPEENQHPQVTPHNHKTPNNTDLGIKDFRDMNRDINNSNSTENNQNEGIKNLDGTNHDIRSSSPSRDKPNGNNENEKVLFIEQTATLCKSGEGKEVCVSKTITAVTTPSGEKFIEITDTITQVETNSIDPSQGSPSDKKHFENSTNNDKNNQSPSGKDRCNENEKVCPQPPKESYKPSDIESRRDYSVDIDKPSSSYIGGGSKGAGRDSSPNDHKGGGSGNRGESKSNDRVEAVKDSGNKGGDTGKNSRDSDKCRDLFLDLGKKNKN
ncbi:MAG: hypothetical protein N3G21_03440 [Candidatus Hydrogenedentes bacterium]|nr:hypothetical protein [Candidatus Hydrogenedentota bacterium]